MLVLGRPLLTPAVLTTIAETGQPSDPVREWGVMEKGNAPRRSAPTKHAALQRVRGTKNSHRDRLGRNSRIPRGIPTARGRH